MSETATTKKAGSATAIKSRAKTTTAKSKASRSTRSKAAAKTAETDETIQKSESPVQADTSSAKRRGRPRKTAKSEETMASTEVSAPETHESATSGSGPKRRPGRPSKVVMTADASAERNADKEPGDEGANKEEADRENVVSTENNGKNISGGNGKNSGNGKQNSRNNDHRRQRRSHESRSNREVVPSVSKEELAELKVAELRARADELEIEVLNLKKAELIDAVYDASVKAEGFREVTGILDILSDGYGFLRAVGYLPSEDDAYVGLSIIRRNGLRKGDTVTGQTRPVRDNEKFAAIQKVISINGVPVEDIGDRPRFADLTPIYPDERLLMEHGKNTITARVIDLCAPIGKGQRGLIVSPPKAGKTTILKDIAAAITANNPEVHLMCLLVDERPEEVTDMQRSIHGEVVSSTFDMPCENHIAVAELVIERAKRLVEMGEDVVILLDSITRLARAYNLAQPASGRILSGGVDSTALYPPKRFLGAARNIENGGSLTILASALIDTGSKMDEVIFEEFKGTGNMELRLDRNLADRRIFPAIDPITSGTRKEELLLDPQEAALIWAVRRILSNMNNTERAMDMLIKSLKQTDNNQEFLLRTAKKAQTQHGATDENFEF